jgi:hypothetical protein
LILVESLIITDNAKRVEMEVFVAMQIREFQNCLDLGLFLLSRIRPLHLPISL